MSANDPNREPDKGDTGGMSANDPNREPDYATKADIEQLGTRLTAVEKALSVLTERVKGTENIGKLIVAVLLVVLAAVLGGAIFG